MNNSNTAEIMEKGMACLLENLGEIETERFISVIIRERFDYTKWRKSYFAPKNVINKKLASTIRLKIIVFASNVMLSKCLILLLSKRYNSIESFNIVFYFLSSHGAVSV